MRHLGTSGDTSGVPEKFTAGCIGMGGGGGGRAGLGERPLHTSHPFKDSGRFVAECFVCAMLLLSPSTGAPRRERTRRRLRILRLIDVTADVHVVVVNLERAPLL